MQVMERYSAVILCWTCYSGTSVDFFSFFFSFSL